MTNQEKIQFIRERCIKANPDIKKLEFGCEVEWKGAGASKGIFIKDKRDDSKSYLFYGSDRVETFDKEQCKEHVSIIGRPIHLADVLLAIQQEGWSDQNPMANGMNTNTGSAPVIYTAVNTNRNNVTVNWTTNEVTKGVVYYSTSPLWSEETTLYYWQKLCKKWTLKKDNLQDQSPETIDFIYSLLTK